MGACGCTPAVRGSDQENPAGPILGQLDKRCSLPVEQLRRLAEDMVAKMHAGLEWEDGNLLKMIISYVDNLPTGDERELRGRESRVVNREFKEVSIPPELMVGPSEELIDFIAEALANFVAKESEYFHVQSGRQTELGLTFSFPVNLLGGQTEDGLKEKRGAMMIVSVLIATLTYQASLNPPGGFWQDSQHRAGTAVNANVVGFKLFLIANTVGLFASLIIILLLTSALNIRRQIMMWLLTVIMWVSVFSVALSFFCGVVMVVVGEPSDPAVVYITAFGLGCVSLFFVLVLLHTLIGSKKIYRWLNEKISHCENVDPASHSLSNETAYGEGKLLIEVTRRYL